MKEIRRLKPDEIEVKVQSFTQNRSGTVTGAILIPYINRGAGITILNETFGITGWQIPADGYRIDGNRMTCNILLYDEEKKEWISKIDGTSHNPKATDDKTIKGEMTDAFKRVCQTLGIGIELNPSPFIYVKAGDINVETNKSGNPVTYDKFACTSITYSDSGRITSMEVMNQKSGQIIYRFKAKAPASMPATKPAEQPKPVAASKPIEAKAPAPAKDATPKEEEGVISIPLSNAKTFDNPGDYVIPGGYAKGKTLARLYEMQENVVMRSKGEAFKKIDVFEWYINHASEFDDELQSAIRAFCA